MDWHQEKEEVDRGQAMCTMISHEILVSNFISTIKKSPFHYFNPTINPTCINLRRKIFSEDPNTELFE